MKYLIPDKLYNVLKWVGLVACPAIAVFVAALGSAWGWEVTPWVLTVNAVGVLIGALIGVSQATAKAGGASVPEMTDEEIQAVYDADDK